MSVGWLGWNEAVQLLMSGGVPRPVGALVATGAELAGQPPSWAPPYVVKIVGPDPLHKADRGLLRLGVCDLREAASLTDELLAEVRKSRPGTEWSALVQPMVLGGTELFVGTLRDSEFGPVVSVGFGGGLVENLKRVTFRSCLGLTPQDVEEMLEETHVAAALAGRCAPAVSEQFIKLVSDVAGLMVSVPQVIELDLNPVIVSSEQLVLVDARIHVT